MSTQPLTRIPTGGVNRTNLAHATDPNDWWTLNNLRPINGALEQTHHLQEVSLIDGTPKQVRLLELILNKDGSSSYLVGSSEKLQKFGINATYTPRETIFCVKQIVGPTSQSVLETVIAGIAGTPNVSAEVSTGVFIDVQAQVGNIATADVNRQCLLYGVTKDNFGNLGDTLTVMILSATTAQWQFNNGPLYPFTIANTVVIDQVRGFTLAFMATDNFNVGDFWTWQNTINPGVINPENLLTVTTFKIDVYITGYGAGRSILRYRDGILTTVGYLPIYGRHAVVFYNHLVVSQFAQGYYSNDTQAMVDPFDSSITPWRLAWSHLNDPDQFYPTDLNEADQYDFSTNTLINRFSVGITGFEVFNDILYIFQANSIHTMRYVGLPNVMQIDILSNGIGSVFFGGLVRTPKGLFFIGQDNIYSFTAYRPEKCGLPVKDQFFQEIQDPEINARWHWTFGKYDVDRAEVVWTYWIPAQGGTYQGRQLIYQVDFNRFFFRNLPSDGIDGQLDNIRAWLVDTFYGRNSLLYGGYGRLLSDSQFNDDDPTKVVKDSVDPETPHTEPTAQTPQLVYGDLFTMKEHSSMRVAASFSEGGGLEITHSTAKQLGSSMNDEVLSPPWTIQTSPDGTVSAPRIAARVFQYGFKFSNNQTTGITRDSRLYGYVDMLYTGKAER